MYVCVKTFTSLDGCPRQRGGGGRQSERERACECVRESEREKASESEREALGQMNV